MVSADSGALSLIDSKIVPRLMKWALTGSTTRPSTPNHSEDSDYAARQTRGPGDYRQAAR